MTIAASESWSRWLQIAARDALAWISGTVGAISAVGWVFIALAGLALLWVWSSMHASTRLGPIEVALLEHDDGPPAAVHALTAGFRERLSTVGLTPPPVVPEGTPQATLIRAVESSTIPQGASIARLLEILPSPPGPTQYKVTGTLFGPANAAPETAAEHGVNIWLQPTNGGSSYLSTVKEGSTHADALNIAAVDIYLHIASCTPDAFPLWVRWRTRDALEAYLDGHRLHLEGQVGLAERTLARAVAASPFNALAALRLANLRERSAAVATSPWATAYTRSLALRGYLDVGLRWPTLVEARYRCAVTAAALATTYERLAPNQRAAIRRLLPLAGPDDEFAQRLQRLAARESSATVQLLKPWYTLVREQRLRNQFESKGHERRALRHTVAISRHCVRMRKNATGGGGAWIVARFDDAIVHAVHMSVGKAYITWQGRYNAASFDALQLRRKGMRRRRRKRVERRALRNLDGAIREAAGELTRTWVHHDPDLVYFRERTTQPAEDEANSAATELQHARAPMRATWEEIVARAPDPATQHEPGREVPVPADVPRPTRAGSLRLPDRPWGDPQLRRIAWSLGLGIVVLAILSLAWLADADPVLLLVVGLVAGLPVVRRLVTAWVERQMADWSEPPADEAALPN